MHDKPHEFNYLEFRSFGPPRAIVSAYASRQRSPRAIQLALENNAMNRTLKLGALLAIVTIFAALPAKADSGQTLDYTLSGGPISASWSMSQDPTPFFVEDGTAFAVNSTDLIVGNLPVDDIICFFNFGDSGGMNTVTYLPDFYGAQLYSGPEDSPTMLIGTFYLTDAAGDCYTLNVTQAPEPMTWLLLATGLAALALKRRNLLAN
jgi:hypothetical protein